MIERATAIVLISRELLAELGDWSQPVQVKIIETPGVGTGYELIARTVTTSTWRLGTIGDSDD